MQLTLRFEPRVTLEVLMDEVINQLEVDACGPHLNERDAARPSFQAGRGFHTDALHHTALRLGEGYAGKTALERKLMRVPDLRQDPDAYLRSPLIAQEGFVS